MGIIPLKINLSEKSGETQEELAITIGYGPTTVTNYEKGIRIPDFVNIILQSFS